MSPENGHHMTINQDQKWAISGGCRRAPKEAAMCVRSSGSIVITFVRIRLSCRPRYFVSACPCGHNKKANELNDAWFLKLSRECLLIPISPSFYHVALYWWIVTKQRHLNYAMWSLFDKYWISCMASESVSLSVSVSVIVMMLGLLRVLSRTVFSLGGTCQYLGRFCFASCTFLVPSFLLGRHCSRLYGPPCTQCT